MKITDQEYRLKKILASWEDRSQVRQNTLLPEELFDIEKKDFLPEWLPFFGHPIYNDQRHLESKILSIAWLVYNQVTLDIENEVVIPLCLYLQSELKDESLNTLIIQAMIDESYHVLLTAHACAVVRKKRQLGYIAIPKSGFVKDMQKCQDLYKEQWKKDLICLATGIVTEVLIGAYLGKIAYCKDDSLQPFNLLVTKSHMMDESVHGQVFAILANKFIPKLPGYKKRFFKEIFPKAVFWYFNNKQSGWEELLSTIGFKDGERMLNDCARKTTEMFEKELWSKIEAVADNIGCLDFRNQVLNIISGKS